MTRTAIIAAMPGELKPLVAGLPHSTRNGIHFWAQRDEEDEWIAACAGSGQPAATRAFAAIEDGGPIDLVFSIGWAGALRAEILAGTAHNVAGVIDVRTGERFRCDAGAGELWLVTSPKVAPHSEKRRLTSTYQAALVDMEAAAVARLAEHYYGRTRFLLPQIDPVSRPALWVLVSIYHALLKRIERANYDVFGRRASVPLWQKLAILAAGLVWTAWARVFG